ncbi:MAG TPA: type II secretion system F family protein [Victivallales bacterium]|nr:type II secretion system F family protein [Victivallales bacterium]HPO89965.1 type II secretion system F family protein [Victivallales bacterium]
MNSSLSSILTVLSSFFAGLSTAFAFLYLAGLFEKIEMEKTQEEEKSLPLLIRLFLPLAGNMRSIVKMAYLEENRKRFREMIIMAGLEEIIDEERFIAVNILLAIFGAVFAIILIVGGQILIGMMIFILLVLYPRMWLNSAVRRRHLEIQKALPNVLDLLTLSVEAGKDFLTSLRDILLRRRRDALSQELERTFQEIQLGKQRRVALRELARRVQQPDLTSVLNAIIQADELGVSIAHILRIQGDQLRIKRFSRAEKLANEAPVKILFPLALFILPAVVLILLGPILLRSFKTIFH